ncbi:MAG: glycosyltransferase family 4 protein, partial [Ignavibacteria bacterium]
LPLKRIVCSKHMQNLLMDKFNSDSELIYIGLDRDRFYNDNKKYNTPPVITFQDHSLPNKNVEGAIYTCDKLKSEFPGLHFRCFGIKKYHALPEYIQFTENPDDKQLTEIYSNTDIFLFSSKYEGFGSPPSEAMACKCAIVANKVAAIPEYSEHMKTAIHADPDDIDGLYKGAKYLLENPDMLKKISEAAYIHIREFMNWDKAIIHFEKYISS